MEVLNMEKSERVTRRSFIKKAAAGAAGIAVATQLGGSRINAEEAKPQYPLLITAMDGVLRQRAKVESIEIAYKVGMDGLQVQYVPDLKNPDSLRHKSVEIAYRNAAHQYGVQISSLCIGALGSTPLKSEPEGVVWVMEAIKCARNLGSKVILLPILGGGHLETEDEFKRLIAVLKQLAPHAGDEGIVLGLECWISAEDQLRIVNEVAHPAVKVYYDPRNALGRGFEPLEEIPLLGEHICEVHVKNGRNLMRVKEILRKPTSTGRKEGLDQPAIAAQLKKIGYKGWISLETSVISGDPIADAIDNIAYVREVFNIFE